MAKLSLNKSALHRERQQLALYQKVLPSLDLKRRQLMRETVVARHTLHDLQVAIEAYARKTAEKYPMLAHEKLGHEGVVRIAALSMGSENIVGVHLPLLENVTFEAPVYPLLGRPAWTEMLIARIEHAVKMELEKEVLHHRITLLERALTKVTQRVNLFEKVLIPTAKANIKKIVVVLDDMQRASVVRSKIAKAKHEGERG